MAASRRSILERGAFYGNSEVNDMVTLYIERKRAASARWNIAVNESSHTMKERKREALAEADENYSAEDSTNSFVDLLLFNQDGGNNFNNNVPGHPGDHTPATSDLCFMLNLVSKVTGIKISFEKNNIFDDKTKVYNFRLKSAVDGNLYKNVLWISGRRGTHFTSRKPFHYHPYFMNRFYKTLEQSNLGLGITAAMLKKLIEEELVNLEYPLFCTEIASKYYLKTGFLSLDDEAYIAHVVLTTGDGAEYRERVKRGTESFPNNGITHRIDEMVIGEMQPVFAGKWEKGERVSMFQILEVFIKLERLKSTVYIKTLVPKLYDGAHFVKEHHCKCLSESIEVCPMHNDEALDSKFKVKIADNDGTKADTSGDDLDLC